MLCAWLVDYDTEFSLEFQQLSDHMYILVSYYNCILTRKCFDSINNTGFVFPRLNQEMVTTDGIKLTTGCQAFILDLIQNGGTDKDH